MKASKRIEGMCCILCAFILHGLNMCYSALQQILQHICTASFHPGFILNCSKILLIIGCLLFIWGVRCLVKSHEGARSKHDF